MPQDAEYVRMTSLEREQRRTFAEILLEEIGLHELLRARERWELLCEQRGWPVPRDEITSSMSSSPFP